MLSQARMGHIAWFLWRVNVSHYRTTLINNYCILVNSHAEIQGHSQQFDEVKLQNLTFSDYPFSLFFTDFHWYSLYLNQDK